MKEASRIGALYQNIDDIKNLLVTARAAEPAPRLLPTARARHGGRRTPRRLLLVDQGRSRRKIHLRAAMSKRSSSSGRDSDLYNPSSKYEEFTEVQGLTLYEIYREPRRGDPSSTIRLDINDINAAFQCPICLGYIKNCRTVMECLHRFCEDCIEKYIRLGKKECPQCRKPVPSRRSLR